MSTVAVYRMQMLNTSFFAIPECGKVIRSFSSVRVCVCVSVCRTCSCSNSWKPWSSFVSGAHAGTSSNWSNSYVKAIKSR